MNAETQHLSPMGGAVKGESESPALKRELIDLDTRPESQSVSYVGMVVFLGSWAMMFGALFFAYGVLRTRLVSWPPPGELPLPLLVPSVNTAVLILSSATIHLGLRALRSGSLESFRGWLLTTIALAATFFALQFLVWSNLWADGLKLSSGVYGSLFYTLTVFHILHVIVGMGLLIWLVLPTLGRNPIVPRRVPVKLASMFWHFVDVVWIAMFSSVYVL